MPQVLQRPPDRLLTAAHASAVAAIRQAGAAAAAARRRVVGTTARRKATGDFVTATDLRCERLLRRLLLQALPEAGFLGEETKPTGLDRDFVWVVDPIDGTSNFANELPHWAVAAALLWRRQPVLAAMWCSPEGALYSAIDGRGARREGRRLPPIRARWDDGAIVGCQWHRGQQDMQFLADLQRDGARVRTFGCTVVQLVDVACGRLDGNVQQQGRIWDIVAPGLLLQEAGGRLTDWAGAPVFPFASLDLGHVPTIGAGPSVHRSILRLLRPRPASRR
jgi:myo-inositol-1(or 4)-monophosphatase